ncbi:MAG: alpha/beta hydrolase-fold protein, partial [Gemmatimonadota bacterium]|nr:alpha/beta hydrolase-fold protein [Gemmatimonadota bacterium]
MSTKSHPDPDHVAHVSALASATEHHSLTGHFQIHRAFHSRFLSVDHDVIVYLPPGYVEGSHRRYPVLYMHDGQNLFDIATSFGKTEWGMDEAAQTLILTGAIDPLIIVGIYNAGALRIDEYTPTRDSAKKVGGKANLYGRMLVEELKPFIDGEYRTLPDLANTGLGGSSLGGLVSLYLGLKYAGIFGRLGILSPSVWWDNRFIVRRVKALSTKPPQRIWLSTGTAEGRGVAKSARTVRDALIAKGWVLGGDLAYFEVEGGTHHESAWAAIMEPMLRFLFPRSGV